MFIVAGKYYKQKIKTPPEDITRPTSSRLRETLFNILQEEVEGADFLDIFAGSGAIGIEALSRGAKTATFIEMSRPAYLILNQNLEALKIKTGATVLYGDYIKNMQALGKRNAAFHVIFADAPYAMKEATSTLLEQVASHKLLKPSGKLFIENETLLPESLELYGLQHINSRKSGKTYLHQFKRVL